jgi:hypothetical protein
MQNVFSCFQEGSEIRCKLIYIDLGGLGHGSISHSLIEFVKGHTLPQIIRILDTIQFIVETDIGNITGLKMLFAEICCRAAG